MFVKIKFPTTVAGLGRVVPGQIISLTGVEAVPLIAAGKVTPDPYLDELKRRAREQGQNADWEKQPQFQNLQARAGVVASAESFGQKLKEAVKKRTAGRSDTRQAHGKNAEKERSRYRKPVRRAPTKGE